MVWLGRKLDAEGGIGEGGVAKRNLGITRRCLLKRGMQKWAVNEARVSRL
jgi:hypothetical protein